MQGKSVSVVVPIRNEQENVLPLLMGISAETSNCQCEVILVDDSTDEESAKAAVERAKAQIGVHVALHHYYRKDYERWGKLSGSVVDGLRRSSAAVTVVMDGDMQHPPKVIPDLVAKINAGSGIVIGSRYMRGGGNEGLDGAFRHLVSIGAMLVAKLLFPHVLRGVSDPMSGCFALRTGAVDPDMLQASGFKILLEILANNTQLARTEVPLKFAKRTSGASKAGEGAGKDFLMQLPRLKLRLIRVMLARKV